MPGMVDQLAIPRGGALPVRWLDSLSAGWSEWVIHDGRGKLVLSGHRKAGSVIPTIVMGSEHEIGLYSLTIFCGLRTCWRCIILLIE